jgi:hypothetical protein
MDIEHAVTLVTRSRTPIAIRKRAVQPTANSQSGQLWGGRLRFPTDL